MICELLTVKWLNIVCVYVCIMCVVCCAVAEGVNNSSEDNATGSTNEVTAATKQVRLLDSDPFVLHYLPSTISDDGT